MVAMLYGVKPSGRVRSTKPPVVVTELKLAAKDVNRSRLARHALVGGIELVSHTVLSEG